MSREESLRGVAAERFHSLLDDVCFRAPNIGHERAWRQRRTETADEVEDRNDRRSQDYKAAAAHRIGWIAGPSINGATIFRTFEDGRAITADDASGEMTL